ncbi:MAG: prepilin peptidase [Deltaproteobacteria bacterium]|nr:prepilin peptidase [Deltaproteobacteria bacterium]
MSSFAPFILAVFLAVCAVFDLFYRRIPNWLTYPAMTAALIFRGINGGVDELLQGLSGLAVGMALLMPVYLVKGMGAGDVKLMGVVGAFLGPKEAFVAFLWTGVTGGVYALILLALHPHQLVIFLKKCLQKFVFIGKVLFYGVSGAHALSPFDEEPAHQGEGLKVCYGVAIAVGTMGYLLCKGGGHSSWPPFVCALSSRFF